MNLVLGTPIHLDFGLELAHESNKYQGNGRHQAGMYELRGAAPEAFPLIDGLELVSSLYASAMSSAVVADPTDQNATASTSVKSQNVVRWNLGSCVRNHSANNTTDLLSVEVLLILCCDLSPVTIWEPVGLLNLSWRKKHRSDSHDAL